MSSSGKPASSGGGNLVVVRKSFIETVNNSTVLQDDDHLILPVKAFEVWSLRLLLVVNQFVAANDIKFQFAGVLAGGQYRVNTGALTDSTVPITVATALGLQFMTIDAWLNASADGNLVLQWAQGTAVANNLRLQVNSHLLASKLA